MALTDGGSIPSLIRATAREWFQWDLKSLKYAFVAVYVARDMWTMCLALNNMKVLSDRAVPPEIYEIPGTESSLRQWGEQRDAALAECQFLLLETLFNVNLNAAKIVSHYYPYLWNDTAKYGTSFISRAMWFTVFDFLVDEIGRLIASCVIDMYYEGYNFHSRLSSVIPLLLTKLIVMYISIIFFDLFGLKVVAVEIFVYRIISLMVFGPRLMLPSEKITSALEQRLPGADEIIELVNRLGYPKECLLIDRGGSRPPKATYYNFLLFDRIVITKNTFIFMDPAQVTGIVGHEICHWKYYHAIVDHVCRFVTNAAKLYVYSNAYEDPRFAQFFGLEDAHPIIPLMLTHSLVWPIADDVLYGIANVFCAYRELRCDDFACQITSPAKFRGALVKLASFREFHLFDGWFSVWFYGMPSLMDRIKRIDKRIKRLGTERQKS